MTVLGHIAATALLIGALGWLDFVVLGLFSIGIESERVWNIACRSSIVIVAVAAVTLLVCAFLAVWGVR